MRRCQGTSRCSKYVERQLSLDGCHFQWLCKDHRDRQQEFNPLEHPHVERLDDGFPDECGQCEGVDTEGRPCQIYVTPIMVTYEGLDKEMFLCSNHSEEEHLELEAHHINKMVDEQSTFCFDVPDHQMI